MTSTAPCWWTKTKDLSLAPFVRPLEVVHFSIVIGISRGWLKTSCWKGLLSRLKQNYGCKASLRNTD